MTLLDAPELRPSSNKGKTLPAEVYSAEEIARLVKACSLRAKTGVRNRALIVTLYRSGLRLAEALALRPKDLDRDGGKLRVLHGKGDKARTVGMDDAAFTYVDHWLAVRDKLGIGARAPVFCTLRGEEIEQAYIRALLPRLARKVGIEKRCHAHALRHAHACELATEGVELRVISQQLGHQNFSTTDRYLRHLNPQFAIDAIRSRPGFVVE